MGEALVEYRVAARTDPGPRDGNDDSHHVATDGEGERLLLAVADGVGGRARGDQASAEAVGLVAGRFGKLREAGAEPSTEWLVDCIHEANRKVLGLREGEDVRKQPSTTLVVAVVDGLRLLVANVGDSRAYVVSPAGIEQVSRDHSLVAEAAGEGTPLAQLRQLPNAITRSLGNERGAEPDVFERDLEPGSIVLLCSDGLSGSVVDEVLPDAAIEDILRTRPDLETGAADLVTAALAAGTSDNVTVAAAEIGGFERRAAPVPPVPGRRRLTALQKTILGSIAGLLAVLVFLLVALPRDEDDDLLVAEVPADRGEGSPPEPENAIRALRFLVDSPLRVEGPATDVYWASDGSEGAGSVEFVVESRRTSVPGETASRGVSTFTAEQLDEFAYFRARAIDLLPPEAAPGTGWEIRLSAGRAHTSWLDVSISTDLVPIWLGEGR